jgi:SAM-dependent methyltransferase
MPTLASSDGIVWTHVACSLCGADRPRELVVDSLVRGSRTFRFPVVACRSCGFVYVTPRGVGEALANTTGGGSWQSAADVNARIYRGGLARLRQAGLPELGRLLDIGAAYGDFLAFAAGQGHPGVGVELDPGPAAAARDRGLDVHTGDLRAMDLGGDFAAVTLWDVIEHVDDPVGLLRAAAAALGAGGLLFFHTGNARFQIPKARVLCRLAPNGGPYLASHQHLSHFDARSARRSLAAAGLEPVAVFHTGTLLYPSLAKRLAMTAANACLAVPSYVGGPLLTSSLGALGRRPA